MSPTNPTDITTFPGDKEHVLAINGVVVDAPNPQQAALRFIEMLSSPISGTVWYINVDDDLIAVEYDKEGTWVLYDEDEDTP